MKFYSLFTSCLFLIFITFTVVYAEHNDSLLTNYSYNKTIYTDYDVSIENEIKAVLLLFLGPILFFLTCGYCCGAPCCLAFFF